MWSSNSSMKQKFEYFLLILFPIKTRFWWLLFYSIYNVGSLSFHSILSWLLIIISFYFILFAGNFFILSYYVCWLSFSIKTHVCWSSPKSTLVLTCQMISGCMHCLQWTNYEKKIDTKSFIPTPRFAPTALSSEGKDCSSDPPQHFWAKTVTNGVPRGALPEPKPSLTRVPSKLLDV